MVERAPLLVGRKKSDATEIGQIKLNAITSESSQPLLELGQTKAGERQEKKSKKKILATLITAMGGGVGGDEQNLSAEFEGGGVDHIFYMILSFLKIKQYSRLLRKSKIRRAENGKGLS